MNGIADMGGMHGFGPVRPTDSYVPFNADWERRTLGITFSTLGDGFYNADEIRKTTESIAPARYLRMSYFERWLHTTEALLVQKKVISEADLAAGRAVAIESGRKPTITPKEADSILLIGASTRMKEGAAPRFRAGDAVRARNINPEHHTRLPRYVRGKPGIVVKDNGIFSLPDSNSQGLGGKPQHVYAVRFRAADLWGESASPRDTLQLEMFDDYLEPAP